METSGKRLFPCAQCNDDLRMGKEEETHRRSTENIIAPRRETEEEAELLDREVFPHVNNAMKGEEEAQKRVTENEEADSLEREGFPCA